MRPHFLLHIMAPRRAESVGIRSYTGRLRERAWGKSLVVFACLAAAPLADSTESTVPATAAAAPGCLASGNGFLRARIRGALNLDINWKNAELECDGSERPDGHGIRLSFAGPMRSGGRRLRMVFGVASAAEGAPGRALPTNLTIIFEGEQRLYSTRGEDRCTVDELREERVGALGPTMRSYRVIARGFCTLPATALDRDERILVTRFDFAGRVNFDDPSPHPGTENPK
jgi:hypothetical protein